MKQKITINQFPSQIRISIAKLQIPLQKQRKKQNLILTLSFICLLSNPYPPKFFIDQRFPHMQHSLEDSSFNQILQMMKHFRVDTSHQPSQKSRDSSTIDFSHNYSSRPTVKQHRSRSPLSNISNRYNNVFEKLYEQKKSLDNRRTLMEYQSRRSKEEKQRSQCTFSPNIRSKMRTQYDSVDNETFYNKNIEWQERKEKLIKVKQVEKNQENVTDLTFTPKINKFNKAKVIDNGASLYQAKGVEDFLNRQKKVKKIQQFIQTRKKNPYSHVWNVKKGHFSYIK